MRRSSPSPAVLAVIVLLASLAASDIQAALFVPTKTSDSADGACTATDCSLREAVLAANAAPGSDVILLGLGTYALSLAGTDDAAAVGDLDVADDLVVAGESALSTVVHAGQVDRVFHVLDGATLELRDVTLASGLPTGHGGALLVQGDATLLRGVVRDSRTVGAGTNGGGAYVAGGASLAVVDSTLTGNEAVGAGGAIHVVGTLDLVNSTLTANLAGASGGGFYAVTQSVVAANNATIARNTAHTAGGGLFAESSALLGFAPAVTNSIVAANQAPAHPDCSGPISSGYSLIGDGTGCIGPAAAKGDLVGTTAAPVDALLGVLESSGPTPVLLPAPGSPAVDAANPAAPGSVEGACEVTDQRGATRPGGPRCDIGAVERTSECVAGGDTLCLQDGRFRVRARWAASPGTGTAAFAQALTGDAGYFWFVDPENVEVTVKVLDGCAINDHFWVFAAGMTNVRVELTVTDTEDGETKTYVNPLDRRFRTITDTSAFDCP